MQDTEQFVVICRGPHCREQGALPLRKRLVGLLRGHPSVRLLGYNCFGQCDNGPNVLFYPEGTWYGRLRHPDAAERVVAHALGEKPLDQVPLDVPSGERELHLRNVEELVNTVTPRDSPGARPWWAFWRR